MEAKLDEYTQDAGGLPEKFDDKGLIVYTMLYGDGIGPDGVAGSLDDTPPDGTPDEGARVYLSELDPISTSNRCLPFVRGVESL